MLIQVLPQIAKEVAAPIAAIDLDSSIQRTVDEAGHGRGLSPADESSSVASPRSQSGANDR